MHAHRAPVGSPLTPSVAWAGGAVLLFFLVSGASPAHAAGIPGFAQDWTVPFVHAGNPGADASYTEIMGSGACVLDADGDGWQDLLLVNGKFQNASLQQQRDPRTQLYRNVQGTGFVLVPGALNVSAWGMGCAVGDYDRDGKPDVAINTWGGPLLFHNDGDGAFSNVTASAGVGRTMCGRYVCFGASIAFLDYDRDGWPDLYALNYVAWDGVGFAAPSAYAGQCDLLFRNLGNSTFRDVSDASGAADCGRNHLALAIADIDQDGWQDIFIACDESSATLLLNQRDGSFHDITIDANVTDYRGGMGATWGDYDRDGRLDLAVTHFDHETFGLFHHEPGTVFSDRAQLDGLALTKDFVGWGIAFADLDDDGWPDLVAANGHVNVSYGAHIGYGERNLVWRNERGTLREVGPGIWQPAAPAQVSRGLALADFDQDGYLDAVFVNNANQSAEIWHSRHGGNNWLALRLAGNATVNPDALGAVVTATVGPDTLHAEVEGASSYLSTSSRDVLLGLGEATQVDALTVAWPDGTSQTFGPTAANQLLTLAAGAAPHVLRQGPLASVPGQLFADRADPATLDGAVLRGAEPVSAAWTIEGTTTTGLRATHAFPALGVVPATLRIEDAAGQWDEATMQVIVRNLPPSAAAAGPAEADRVHRAHFDGRGSSDRDGTVVNWTWTAEGRTSYGPQADIGFSTLGTATVRLVVRDDDGGTASTNATLQVRNLPPVADAGPDLVGNVRSVFHLDGLRSSDPDGRIVAWRWEFGDGESSTEASPVHTYASEGVRVLTLTVTDDDGATAAGTAQVVINAQNAPPVARAGQDRDATRIAPVVFDGSGSYDPDGSIVAWHWAFGDGASADTASVQHTYAALGTFNATLTVTDDTGGVSSTAVQVRVQNLLPSVAPGGAVQQEGLAPLRFAAHAGDADGSIVDIAWSFGDGTTGSGPAPEHAYAALGRFDVVVTATDDDGGSTAVHVPLWLYARPVARPGADRLGDRITTLAFDGSASSDADGQVVAWHWAFGDGAVADGALASHRYATLGTFPVRLTVTDDDGFTASATVDVTVRNLLPLPVLDAYVLANVNQSLPYAGLRSSDPDGRIVAYAWSFGDGGTASAPAPKHAFAATGTFRVRLTVTDDDGGSASAQLDVQVVDWLAVSVAMDKPAYGPLETPEGTVRVRFANGLPAPGASVDVANAYRVDLPGQTGVPAATVVWNHITGVTDAAGAWRFRLQAWSPVPSDLVPYVGVPTAHVAGLDTQQQVTAKATWQGNAGTGKSSFDVDVSVGGVAAAAPQGRLEP